MKTVQVTIQTANRLVPSNPSTTGSTAMPKAEVVQQFEQAMTEGATLGEAQGVTPPTHQAVAKVPESIGEAILQGMDKIRIDHDSQFNRVKTLVESPGMQRLDFRHAVHLQFELMQLTLHQDITTKSADKTSQGIQTLFRNQ